MGENLLGLVLDNRRAKKEGPEGIARRAKPIGAMSYCTERPEGLRRAVLLK